MRVAMLVLVSCLLLGRPAAGQVVPKAITNSDVISMTKAGIGQETIIIAIQRGPVKFDTSPQALIALKEAGVTDQVLNAILTSANGTNQGNQVKQSADAGIIFRKAVDAFGAHESVTAIRSYRLKAKATGTGRGKNFTFDREEVRVLPDKDYMTSQQGNSPLEKRVITPDFSYLSKGNFTSSIPPADLETARQLAEFGYLQIIQHPSEYTVTSMGQEERNGALADKIKISKDGKSVVWDVEPATGRLLSTSQETPKGNISIEYSDFRLVQGVYLPFKGLMNEFGYTVTLSISDYEINPVIDDGIFQRPSGPVNEGFTLKVLQEQSVPYTQESGGGISTNCSIIGSANTSANATAIGNSAYGNATTDSYQHMNCNSYDTTIRWPHVLNVMFAQASDGNSYIIACDKAWRWSKCAPLRAGETFNASFGKKGIEVQAFNSKGKEIRLTYNVLQSKTWR